MRELLHSVALRAARYLEDIQERRVSPSAEAVAALARFHEPLPDVPTAPEDVIRMLDEVGSPATMGIAGPRFFGFVIGGRRPPPPPPPRRGSPRGPKPAPLPPPPHSAPPPDHTPPAPARPPA